MVEIITFTTLAGIQTPSNKLKENCSFFRFGYGPLKEMPCLPTYSFKNIKSTFSSTRIHERRLMEKMVATSLLPSFLTTVASTGCQEVSIFFPVESHFKGFRVKTLFLHRTMSLLHTSKPGILFLADMRKNLVTWPFQYNFRRIFGRRVGISMNESLFWMKFLVLFFPSLSVHHSFLYGYSTNWWQGR